MARLFDAAPNKRGNIEMEHAGGREPFKPLVKIDDTPGQSGVHEVETVTEIPDIAWLDAAESPWGVPVLDVRPVALGYMSFAPGSNASVSVMELVGDSGHRFADVQPDDDADIPASLQYRLDPLLADGVLFMPLDTEDRWGLYYIAPRLICVDSWTSSVRVTAEVHCEGDIVRISRIRGRFRDDDEQLRPRILDYLIRTHAMMKVHPVPLPAGFAADTRHAALWAKDLFGRRALFATPHEVPDDAPLPPLRTYSLLHLAADKGDDEAITRLLESGLPVDLPDWRGFTPLFCALDDETTAAQLLGAAANVDARADDGSTALMYAVLRDRLHQVRFLLDRGADPDAQDDRDFTALHRAADLGHYDIAKLLVQRGARVDLVANGYTPLDIAHAMRYPRIERLLRRGRL